MTGSSAVGLCVCKIRKQNDEFLPIGELNIGSYCLMAMELTLGLFEAESHCSSGWPGTKLVSSLQQPSCGCLLAGITGIYHCACMGQCTLDEQNQ